ncbi:S41 family peptidase [Patescibacteria group bacterium]|nr:S41 family peptidase [Patescibacteria group bacterium]MBU1472480.1 S41 family peptidase [Patescibacteria group bacterium]
MKSFAFSKIRFLVVIFALLILSGGIGYRLGERRVRVALDQNNAIVVHEEAPPTVTADFSLFWDVWTKLHRYYIEPVALDAQKMVYGAITGMVSALDDPYTAFLTPKDNKDFKDDLGGSFEGIGAQLGLKDGRIIVIAPLHGMPAEKAGIRAGDFILKVDGEETVGWTVPEAVSKIRGPRGSTVTLTILHESDQKPIDISLKRDVINIPSVESWVKTPGEIPEISALAGSERFRKEPGRVAYIQLSRFGDHTNDEWDKAVDAIVVAQKMNGSLRGLIFDLRNNPGGYLDGAVFIASEFLGQGIVVSQVNSDGTKQDYPVDRKGKLLDIPLVVLVNKGSASAAEIAAGALRDRKRAKLIGETTFGKGSVQTPYDLSGGAGLHITTGKWLLPNGDSIHKTGVKPDIEVKLEETVTASNDAQLAKAIEILLK